VTGVQTCALPICALAGGVAAEGRDAAAGVGAGARVGVALDVGSVGRLGAVDVPAVGLGVVAVGVRVADADVEAELRSWAARRRCSSAFGSAPISGAAGAVICSRSSASSSGSGSQAVVLVPDSGVRRYSR